MKSKIRWPEFDDGVALGLALVGALVAVTCAGSQWAPTPSNVASSSRPTPSPAPSAAPEPATSVADTLDATPEPRVPEDPPGGGSWSEALASLARGKQQSHVRLLWYGDSHSAADFWPHAVRTALQKRFGNGGPGYVLLGVEPYRHGRVKLERSGEWRRLPKQPAGTWKQEDGSFGLAGMRALPQSGDARVKIQLYPGAVVGQARWTFLYRASGNAALVLDVEGEETRQLSAKTGRKRAHLDAYSFTLETKPEARLELRLERAAPEIFGVIVESTRAGVVVDTLGINGARAATPLSWASEQWLGEVRSRTPSLVVLAYGTNEVFEQRKVELYAEHYRKLMSRLRSAVQELECLMVGPTDTSRSSVKDRVQRVDAVQRSVALELGCTYLSLFDTMGGRGSFERWAKLSPPLAAPDEVHLLPKGYKKLGEPVLETLLAGLR